MIIKYSGGITITTGSRPMRQIAPSVEYEGLNAFRIQVPKEAAGSVYIKRDQTSNPATVSDMELTPGGTYQFIGPAIATYKLIAESSIGVRVEFGVSDEQSGDIVSDNFVSIVDSSGSTINPATEEKQDVINGNHLCSENSSDTPLGISETFTGEWEDTLEYGGIVIGIKADQDSATDGLMIEWSTDGITISQDDVFTILADTGKVFTFTPAMRYFRIQYINGITAQGSFALQTIMKKNAFKPSSHRINDSIVAEDDAELIKAVLTGEDDNGIFQNIKADFGGLLRVNSFPYTYAIAEGDIAGHDANLKFGTRTGATTAESTVWEGNTPLYQYMTTAQQLQVVSSSASDTAAGTGARTLFIQGQDIDNNEISETITMNGTTTVTTALSYFRIYRAYVATCGTATTNVGKITIRNNAATVEQAVINAGDSQTLMTLWTVPVGKTMYIVQGTFSSDSNKGARVSLFTRQLDGGILYPWRIRYRAYTFSGNEVFPFVIPFRLPEKTDIEVRFKAVSNGADVGATFEYWYEDT